MTFIVLGQCVVNSTDLAPERVLRIAANRVITQPLVGLSNRARDAARVGMSAQDVELGCDQLLRKRIRLILAAVAHNRDQL